MKSYFRTHSELKGHSRVIQEVFFQDNQRVFERDTLNVIYLIWSQSLLPGHVVLILPLPLDLLQHALKERLVVVDDAQVPGVILLPSGNVTQKFIQMYHVICLAKNEDIDKKGLNSF